LEQKRGDGKKYSVHQRNVIQNSTVQAVAKEKGMKNEERKKTRKKRQLGLADNK